jgi:anti-sigma regulatory factor (Ser/Thr protein kinase)
VQARHAYQLPNHPQSVGRARAWVRAILTADRCCEDTIDSARQIMSELATNGLIHGSMRRSDTITIVCEIDTDILTVGVIDYGSDQPVILDAAEDAEFGRGMALIEDMADDWGQEPCDGGKLVYARLKLPQDCATTDATTA